MIREVEYHQHRWWITAELYMTALKGVVYKMKSRGPKTDILEELHKGVGIEMILT